MLPGLGSDRHSELRLGSESLITFQLSERSTGARGTRREDVNPQENAADCDNPSESAGSDFTQIIFRVLF